MECADRDRTVEKQLEMLTATDSELLKKVRAQISGLKRTKRFHDWKSIGRLREKVQQTVQSIGQLKIDPKKGFELVVSFYETDNAVYGNCDDSSVFIADLYKRDARNLLIKFGSQCDKKSWMAEKIFELNEENQYGVRDDVLSASCEFLPETHVRRLIERYCELASELDEKDDSKKADAWNSASRKYWGAASELAAGIKDGPLHETTYRSFWKRESLNAAAWNDIAQVYLDAGDPETALQRLENIDESNGGYQELETEQLRIAAYKAIGSEASIQNVEGILRKRLFASPSSKTLSELNQFLDPSQFNALVNDLVSGFSKSQKLDLAFLELSLRDIDASISETYLLERSDQIDGDNYYTLAPIAKLFSEKKCPVAATLIYRALADSILKRAISKNYKIAVGYIKRMGKLANDINDWKGHKDHNAYLESLHANHARKTAFWSLME